ncbi:MAG TPA: hypothetical protein VGR59_00695 [Gemmatimonadaceae bacterium]|nr:hypothetical protein [Gemmatimonadaceae bacterium]
MSLHLAPSPRPSFRLSRIGGALATALLLFAAVACHDATGSGGSLRVMTRTTGVDLQVDPYTVSLDGKSPVAVGDSSLYAFTTIEIGRHSVGIGNLAGNCTLDGASPVAVAVFAIGLDTVTFHISCAARPLTFVSERAGPDEMYAIESDGSDVARVSDGTASDLTPSWSADGSHVAFASNRGAGGNYEIYAMNRDGSGVHAITSAGGFNWFPAWSPDGSRIAFESARDGFLAIYVVHADGSGLTRLTADTAGDEHPSWSPDGSRIAFASARGGAAQIYTMAPDGSDAHALTQSADPATAPVYSPDGSRIAYVVVPASGNARLHVMAADGTSDVTVTDGTDFSTFPAWSPDGRKLAFMAQHDGAWQVYIIGANGARSTSLTSTGTNLFPVWTPAAP